MLFASQCLSRCRWMWALPSFSMPTAVSDQRRSRGWWILSSRKRADLVLGARGLAGSHPVHAAAGTRLIARFVAWRWRVPITDFGPLRPIRADLLRSLDVQDRAFGWPVAMVLKAAVVGARILEVPVSHQPRLAGRSKVSGHPSRHRSRGLCIFVCGAACRTTQVVSVTPPACCRKHDTKTTCRRLRERARFQGDDRAGSAHQR